MKTANVYEIERALQQPITPQQRQTAAANNPVAALLAQRLDGVEGSLRTKLQTPPPPQGTVMNQYYQWPQQQQQMGLAQPGLEEMAQQYAAGGLVAFADGGPVLDVDDSYGYGAYAQGGLATMLPMGYAGEEDMPVYGYSRGEEVKLHQYPWRTLGESVEPTIVDDNAEDEDAFWEDMPDVDKLEAQGVRERPIPSVSDTAGMSNDEPWPINPSAIQHPGFDKGRSYLSELGGKISEAEKAIGDRIKGAGQRWSERLAPVTDKYAAREKEVQRLEGLPAAYAAAMESGAPMPPVSYEPTVSGEDRKFKQQQEDRTKEQEARVAEKEKTSKARKASVSVPSANPVRTAEGPGVSVLSPQAWGGGPLGSTAGYEPSTEMAEAPASEQESNVNLNPNNNATAAAIVNSPLSADQQIAAIAKYFQTDTSEAMRIKGEMEKESAHAGNVGIMAVLANALGMGLGTYGTGAARWGAGLMGAAQGFMGEQKAADARQEKINELGLKVKEMEGSGTRKAAELVLNQRAKAAAEADEMKKAMLLERMKQTGSMNVANVQKAGRTEAAQISAAARRATQGAGGMNEYQRRNFELEALKAAEAEAESYYKREFGTSAPTPERAAMRERYKQQALQVYLSGAKALPSAGSTGMSGITPDLFIGRVQEGQFTPHS